MKVVVIGGVAGGASAAARIRRLDESAEIVIFERSNYISYANCGLPYYVGGAIEEEEALTLQSPESFFTRFHIAVHVRHEVTRIYPEKKQVRVRNLETGDEMDVLYDALVFSPGAKPIKPNLPGINSENLFTLRTVEDAKRIHQFIKEKRPNSATVIGGGFIGLEMSENLMARGMTVTIVEKMAQLLGPLDEDMASFVHAKLKRHGAKLMLGSAVTGFEQTKDGLLTQLDNQAPVCAKMVVLAIGVVPDTQLAAQAGLALGVKGSIMVNERMETSAPNIYAVGDAVQVINAVTHQPALISLAGPANKQGRIAADNICGKNSVYQGSYGSSIMKLFDMTVASTGLHERGAKAAGLCFDKVVLSPAGHASYYPGTKAMTMKIVYEKGTLRLLGAQIVGFDGVDKRIDVLATAMQAGLTAPKLKELELAYAPPYSSAKDPVNMAGFMIENIEAGLVKQFHYQDIKNLPRDGSVTLLDTRTPHEYAKGHVEGFINLPVDALRERSHTLDAQKPVYIMCQSGLRSYIACRILSQKGFECFNFSGGYRFYQSIKENSFHEHVFQPCGMG